MKITDIRAAGLRGFTPPGGWSSELAHSDCVHTLLAVLTDEGLIGYGSVFTSERLVRASLELLIPLCKGECPLEAQRVSEKLRQNTFWQGRGGAITHTISGIDMALWDVLGKHVGLPVGVLLGGRYRDRVRPYASVLADYPEPLRHHLAQIKQQGFHAFKIGWGPFGRVDRKLDEAIVRAARETIGDTNLLMVDAGGSDAFWRGDYKWALNASRMLADYSVAWFEEPLRPDALEEYVQLRRHSTVPIAGGEVLTRRQSFQPWLKAGAFDIVQPDVTKVGGLSEAIRIGWTACDNGARLIPHGWNTAMGLAADLQLASALPDTDLVEYIAGSPYVDELTNDGWTLDSDGMLVIPKKPGLGVDLNRDAVGRFASEHIPL